MPPMTFPNQRVVRIHRESVKSDFLGIKNENWQAASRDLGAHGLESLTGGDPHTDLVQMVCRLGMPWLRALDDERDLAPAPLHGPLGELGEPAPDDLLVGLRQLAADRRRSVRTENRCEIGQRLGQPVRGLEEDHRAALIGKVGQDAAPLGGATREEPLEAEAVDRER